MFLEVELVGRGVHTLYGFGCYAAGRLCQHVSAHCMSAVSISNTCSSFCLFRCFGLIIACYCIGGITEDSGFQSRVVYTFN